MLKSGIEGISREVELVFTVTSMVYVYPHLDKVFPRKEFQVMLKKMWSDYESLFEKTESAGRFYLRYMQRELNPILNERLGRPSDFPTWNNLLAYGLRTMIEYSPDCRAIRKDRILQDLRFKFYPGASLKDRMN